MCFINTYNKKIKKYQSTDSKVFVNYDTRIFFLCPDSFQVGLRIYNKINWSIYNYKASFLTAYLNIDWLSSQVREMDGIALILDQTNIDGKNPCILLTILSFKEIQSFDAVIEKK